MSRDNSPKNITPEISSDEKKVSSPEVEQVTFHAQPSVVEGSQDNSPVNFLEEPYNSSDDKEMPVTIYQPGEEEKESEEIVVHFAQNISEAKTESAANELKQKLELAYANFSETFRSSSKEEDYAAILRLTKSLKNENFDTHIVKLTAANFRAGIKKLNTVELAYNNALIQITDLLNSKNKILSQMGAEVKGALKIYDEVVNDFVNTPSRLKPVLEIQKSTSEFSEATASLLIKQKKKQLRDEESKEAGKVNKRQERKSESNEVEMPQEEKPKDVNADDNKDAKPKEPVSSRKFLSFLTKPKLSNEEQKVKEEQREKLQVQKERDELEARKEKFLEAFSTGNTDEAMLRIEINKTRRTISSEIFGALIDIALMSIDIGANNKNDPNAKKFLNFIKSVINSGSISELDPNHIYKILNLANSINDQKLNDKILQDLSQEQYYSVLREAVNKIDATGNRISTIIINSYLKRFKNDDDMLYKTLLRSLDNFNDSQDQSHLDKIDLVAPFLRNPIYQRSFSQDLLSALYKTKLENIGENRLHNYSFTSELIKENAAEFLREAARTGDVIMLINVLNNFTIDSTVALEAIEIAKGKIANHDYSTVSIVSPILLSIFNDGEKFYADHAKVFLLKHFDAETTDEILEVVGNINVEHVTAKKKLGVTANLSQASQLPDLSRSSTSSLTNDKKFDERPVDETAFSADTNYFDFSDADLPKPSAAKKIEEKEPIFQSSKPLPAGFAKASSATANMVELDNKHEDNYESLERERQSKRQEELRKVDELISSQRQKKIDAAKERNSAVRKQLDPLSQQSYSEKPQGMLALELSAGEALEAIQNSNKAYYKELAQLEQKEEAEPTDLKSKRAKLLENFKKGENFAKVKRRLELGKLSSETLNQIVDIAVLQAINRKAGFAEFLEFVTKQEYFPLLDISNIDKISSFEISGNNEIISNNILVSFYSGFTTLSQTDKIISNLLVNFSKGSNAAMDTIKKLIDHSMPGPELTPHQLATIINNGLNLLSQVTDPIKIGKLTKIMESIIECENFKDLNPKHVFKILYFGLETESHKITGNILPGNNITRLGNLLEYSLSSNYKNSAQVTQKIIKSFGDNTKSNKIIYEKLLGDVKNFAEGDISTLKQINFIVPFLKDGDLLANFSKQLLSVMIQTKPWKKFSDNFENQQDNIFGNHFVGQLLKKNSNSCLVEAAKYGNEGMIADLLKNCEINTSSLERAIEIAKENKSNDQYPSKLLASLEVKRDSALESKERKSESSLAQDSVNLENPIEGVNLERNSANKMDSGNEEKGRKSASSSSSSVTPTPANSILSTTHNPIGEETVISRRNSDPTGRPIVPPSNNNGRRTSR